MKRRKPRFKRVYFIGAGLSHSLHYPVGGTLLADLVRYLDPEGGITSPGGSRLPNTLFKSRDRPGRSRILRAIEKVLVDYLGGSRANLERINVAEFFSIVHSLSEAPLLFGATYPEKSARVRDPAAPPRSITRLYDDLAAVTRTYFAEIFNRPAKEVPGDVRSLIDRMDPEEHAIVNFNWDEELDWLLTEEWRKPAGAGTGPDARRRGSTGNVAYTAASRKGEFLMLKPHGSVGWYDVALGLGNERAYFIADGDYRIDREHMRIMAFYDIELPRDVARDVAYALGFSPVITPPTFAKRFLYKEQQLIWHDVLDACKEAEEFVFLGYSMPDDDYLTRAAIRRSIGPRAARKCLVVSLREDDTIKRNYQGVFFGRLDEGNFIPHEFGKDQPHGAQGFGLAEYIEALMEEKEGPRGAARVKVE